MLATGGLPFSLPEEVLTGKVINLRSFDADDCGRCVYKDEGCYTDSNLNCADYELKLSWEYTK